jgi:hypothetical protein
MSNRNGPDARSAWAAVHYPNVSFRVVGFIQTETEGLWYPILSAEKSGKDGAPAVIG